MAGGSGNRETVVTSDEGLPEGMRGSDEGEFQATARREVQQAGVRDGDVLGAGTDGCRGRGKSDGGKTLGQTWGMHTFVQV